MVLRFPSFSRSRLCKASRQVSLPWRPPVQPLAYPGLAVRKPQMGYNDVPLKRGCKQFYFASTWGYIHARKNERLRLCGTDDDRLYVCFNLVRKGKRESGEALRAVSATLAFFSWIVYLPVAIVLCMECILGFFLLWGRGIVSVIEWYKWRSSRESDFDYVYCCYNMMPGEERRHHREWGEAVNIAPENDFENKRDPGSKLFNVDAFLKMTTGRDMKDLVPEIQRRRETRRSRKSPPTLMAPKLTPSVGGSPGKYER